MVDHPRQLPAEPDDERLPAGPAVRGAADEESPEPLDHADVPPLTGEDDTKGG